MRAYRSPAETRLSAVFSAGDDADAVRRACGRAERAADALLEAVLVPVQAVAAAVARVHRALVLRVLLRDRLLEDLLQA